MIDYNERDPWPMPPTKDLLQENAMNMANDMGRDLYSRDRLLNASGLAGWVRENVPAREMKDSLWLKLWDMPGNAWDRVRGWFK